MFFGRSRPDLECFPKRGKSAGMTDTITGLTDDQIVTVGGAQTLVAQSDTTDATDAPATDTDGTDAADADGTDGADADGTDSDDSDGTDGADADGSDA